MNYEIIQLESFYLNGIKHQFTMDTMNQIPALWEKLDHDGTLDRLAMTQNVPALSGSIGACLKFEPMDCLNYFVSTASTTSSDAYESIHIPASLWVKFEAKGPIPIAIQDTFEYAYGSWFENHPYKPKQTADLERYPENFDPDYPVVEIWIPIEEEN